MINTYSDEVIVSAKISEELRLIRCLLERFLSAKYPQYFVDYQMEKYGKNYKTKKGNT